MSNLAISNLPLSQPHSSSFSDGERSSSQDESRTRPQQAELQQTSQHESETVQPQRVLGWTLGNSGDLVGNVAKEPLWVSLAWIAVPSVAAIFVLAYFFN